MLAWNHVGHQSVLVLLLPGMIFQSRLWRNQALSLHHHRHDEHILASFKSCWKGSQERCILVDMHKPAPWGNTLMFPSIIKDKWNEPPMNDCLTALVKRVAELCEAELKACHCVDEFHLR
jgi:hypothetical protein